MSDLNRLEERREELHRKIHGAAPASYLCTGCVPQRLHVLLEATRSFEALEKYNPSQPRAPAGSPDGGQWVDGGDSSTYPESSVKSRKDAEAIVEKHRYGFVGKDRQCASLVHSLSPKLPSTRYWKPGQIVQGHTDIPLGTPIATFNYQGQAGTNGYGPVGHLTGLSGHSHTGIYLGQNKVGVEMLHQWPTSKGPTISTLPWSA